MGIFLKIIALVAFFSFIVYNVGELILVNKCYKKMEKEHQEFLDALIEETLEELVEKRKKRKEND